MDEEGRGSLTEECIRGQRGGAGGASGEKQVGGTVELRWRTAQRMLAKTDPDSDQARRLTGMIAEEAGRC